MSFQKRGFLGPFCDLGIELFLALSFPLVKFGPRLGYLVVVRHDLGSMRDFTSQHRWKNPKFLEQLCLQVCFVLDPGLTHTLLE